MFVAAQYYRAPFPNRRYWADDFSRVRDAGLHAVQLWALWGWIESTPNDYRYDDYDELIALADKKGLKVVLSTIAEIHPFWIHRLIPDSHLVNHLGQPVVSGPRTEVNVGVTPGGCFDNPLVAEKMRAFLADVAGRYAGASNLIGWDCWNETRWTVHADGHTCYCPHTLREFRGWLARRHGGLDGLNAAWQRRYDRWDDVMPGKLPGRPYTETVEFLRFLAERAARHARFRYDAIRSADPTHIITAHCAYPAVHSVGWEGEQTLCRGNDWDLADQLDGFGSSHFPFWGGDFQDEWLNVRLEAVRSANQGRKTTWISEYHGGSARDGVMAHVSVDATAQQRGIATGMARAAKAVIFWCWRDEVFGRESSGFGFDGLDGQAAQRRTAMKKTAAFINKHNDLIDAYVPEPAEVGVLFSPDAYMLNWAERGNITEAKDAIDGYALALERLAIPYEFVDARHLDVLDTLKVLLMPWALVVPDQTREAIVAFIRRGGRVLVGAEADAFDELAFYRYPAERPLMQAIGVHDLGRRRLGDDRSLPAELNGRTIDLLAYNFTTPLHAPKADVLARDEHDQPLLVRQPLGHGAAYVAGTFLPIPYARGEQTDLPALLTQVFADAGVTTSFRVCDDAGEIDKLYWRVGRAGRENLLWISNAGPQRTVTITDRLGRFGTKTAATELVSGRPVQLARTGAGKTCTLAIAAGAYAVLRW